MACHALMMYGHLLYFDMAAGDGGGGGDGVMLTISLVLKFNDNNKFTISFLTIKLPF